MLREVVLLMVVGVLCGSTVNAAAQTGEARGVNPADNITKFELLPKLSVIDDGTGVSVTTFTLKYDRAIRGTYGINVELPLARFESPSISRNGLGDLNVRGRTQFTMGRCVGILGAEAVVPVATDDTLGSGKFQLNPTAVAVYPFSSQVFLAVVAKQFLSVAGDDERANLRQGLYRALVAYSSPKGWWVLGDPQLYVDYDSAGRNDFQLEGEVGKMVGPMTGVWLRGGGHVGGNWARNEWSISAGIRFIRL